MLGWSGLRVLDAGNEVNDDKRRAVARTRGSFDGRPFPLAGSYTMEYSVESGEVAGDFYFSTAASCENRTFSSYTDDTYHH